MLSAHPLVYTEVIDIKRLDIGQHRAVGMLLEDAKAVAKHFVFFVRENEDRALFIL